MSNIRQYNLYNNNYITWYTAVLIPITFSQLPVKTLYVYTELLMSIINKKMYIWQWIMRYIPCTYDEYMLYTCCIHTAYMMHTCCIHAVYMLHTWCIHAVYMLHTCCIHAAYMMHVYSILALCMIYTYLHITSEVDSRSPLW